jgi:DNA-binding response OmpR family regulator
MDIRLGSVNGIELCKSLRTRIDKSVRIIAMTAMAEVVTSAGGFECFDGILRKPFRSEDLYSALNLHDRFAIVRKMTNNDEQLFQSVLADFVGETDRDILMVEKAIAEQQNEAMLVLVHKLSGRVNQFGYSSLSSSLRQVERELDLGSSTEEMKGRWSDLKERLQLVVTEVKNSL